MQITIMYFAALKDQMKKSEDNYETATGATPASVAREILGFDTLLLFAVNDEIVARDRLLCDGDRLAFIPPMAGG
jgi:molybdopterin converting factor small subunit